MISQGAIIQNEAPLRLEVNKCMVAERVANQTYMILRISLARPFATCSTLFKSAASSSRWLNRQNNDYWTQQAKADNFRSRAAYKLEQIHAQFRLFKAGMTVVDLGFAPGSWSQVAVKHTRPHGRVIGVDLLQVEPPRGVSCIQGNFLEKSTKDRLREVLTSPMYGRAKPEVLACLSEEEAASQATAAGRNKENLIQALSQVEKPESKSQTVDIVLSDMLANTSGLITRDHSRSIELCDAALKFAIEVLRPGGSLVCKFYTGDEDKSLEQRLRRVFKFVKRVKPDACRNESREMYFVAQRKKPTIRGRKASSDEINKI